MKPELVYLQTEQFPPEVALRWAVEDILEEARRYPAILDEPLIKDCADRLSDAIGSRQERTAP